MSPIKRISRTCLLLLLAWSSIAHAGDTEQEVTDVSAVIARIAAFNNHDIDSYLLAHHKDVEIYEFPEEPIGKGRAHLKNIFGPMLEQEMGNITVVHQTVVGNRVISAEQVSYGPTQEELLVAIYTVENGLIKSIHLVEQDN